MTQHITPIRRHVSPIRGAAGATLIELLAVIIIMTMLAAAALPVIAPAMQNRQVREASRIVNGFLTGARNRAMQTGRPVGVVFERMAGLPEACVTLSYAEIPPPYSGDSLSSTVQLTGGNIQALTPMYDTSQNPPVFIGSADIGWIGSVRVGDWIKFNYIGAPFRITGAMNTSTGQPIPPDANGYFTAAATPGPNCTWTIAPTNLGGSPPSGQNIKYQIIRAPTRMAAGSVQLPGTTVIDLTCSGFDNLNPLVASFTDNSSGTPTPVAVPLNFPWISTQTFQPLPPTIQGASTYQTFASGGADTSSVILTFGPSGAVDRLWCWQTGGFAPFTATGQNPVPTPMRPMQPIHLCIGQREYLPLPAAPPAITDPNASGFKPFLNWQDLGNFWVTISPQTGLVVTNEVVQPAAPTFTVIPGTPPQYGIYSEIWASRQLARQGQGMGGR